MEGGNVKEMCLAGNLSFLGPISLLLSMQIAIPRPSVHRSARRSGLSSAQGPALQNRRRSSLSWYDFVHKNRAVSAKYAVAGTHQLSLPPFCH